MLSLALTLALCGRVHCFRLHAPVPLQAHRRPMVAAAALHTTSIRPASSNAAVALRAHGIHSASSNAAIAPLRTHGIPRMQQPTSQRPSVVLGACLMLSIVSGSFYSWSMLLPALQSSLSCSRAPLSAVFSLATVCFTAGTAFGPMLIDRASASRVVVTIASVSAAGLFLASLAASAASASVGLPLLWLGWGGIFGSMSGLSYALNTKVSTSQVFAGRNGASTGLLSSGRAASPLIATPLVLWALERGGAALALRALGCYMGFALLPVALALRGLSYDRPPSSSDAADATAAENDADAKAAGGSSPPPPPPRWVLGALWVALACGSGPGLLCHGHAAAILSNVVGAGESALAGVGGMAVGSLAGRMGGGLLIDRIQPRRCLVTLPLLAAPVVLAPILRPASVPLTLAAMVSCGLVYGLNAVALPVLVSRLYGQARFSSVYGRVFTAWGFSGVLAPWMAGRLFDLTGGYSAALAFMAASMVVAGLAATVLPEQAPGV